MHTLDNTDSAIADEPSTTATATVAATQTPNPGDKKDQPPAPSAVCRLSVIGPWSEINGTAPYRIEVGGGDVQHMDFYPTIGVQSISYIVDSLPRGGVAAKWYGYGQMWQGNKHECANFDYVKDAVEYAKGNASGQPGRLQQGHSGIVIDLRGGNFKIIEKPKGWTEDQIDALIALHKAAMNPANPPSGGSAQGTGTCTNKEGTRADHKPAKDTAWDVTPTDSFRVVNVWSNQRDPNLGDYKLLLKPGESASLMGGGGAVWSFPATCGDVAQAAYASNSNPVISLAQYKAYVDNGTMP